MVDVFQIYNVTGGVTSDANPPVNLLDCFSMIPYQQVLDNSQMYFEYGDKIVGDNLQWTKELLLNSCNNIL